MRSGKWRGVTLALGLACALTFSAGSPARADGFHTIPRLVPAVDLNTGGPYYAPPVPYGHYAKDCGGKLAKVGGLLHGKGCGLCGACGGKGKGCGKCGGSGTDCGGQGSHGGGHGLFGGHGHGGDCGPNGCGLGAGCGLGNGHGGNGGPGNGGFGNGGFGNGGVISGGFGGGAFPNGGGIDSGGFLNGGHGHLGNGVGHASTIVATGQGMPTAPSPQCGAPGCGMLGNHMHSGCGLCGGKGCNACAKARGLVNHLLHRDKIKWFVGAGGPVPLTPGYTPYVITTRSPRDFLAFPPFTP